MSAKARNKSVDIWGAFAAIGLSLLVAVFALTTGGLSGVVTSMWLMSVVLIWLFFGENHVGGAILAAIVGILSVALLQLGGMLPPAFFEISSPSMWLLLAAMGGVGAAVLFKLRFLKSRADAARRHLVNTGPILPLEDAPFAVIDVTPLGRVRRTAGRVSLIGDIQIGQVFEPQTIARRQSITQDLQDGQRVYVFSSGDDSGEDLREQLAARTRFFAEMGHDLKSPLNAVIGFADMMDAEINGPLPDAYREYPSLIKESGESLLRYVEDFLGYARSEAGTLEMDLAVMDVAASGETVLRQLRASAAMADVTLIMHTAGEALAIADASAVQRIWDNLVSNAIKYAGDGGRVEMSVQSRAPHTIIRVSDNGAGMDADDLARIAAPFEQGRNARGRKGTGLGLAMVKRLAELHGGYMKIETAPGEGTAVSVYLPAAQRLQEAAE